MKRILSVLLITSLFAGNIELDGDVNVTGTIQSQTIESLLEQITQLQEQIALLEAQLNDSQVAENQLESRFFEISLSDMAFLSSSNHVYNLSEITGVYDKPIHIVATPTNFGGCDAELYFGGVSCEGDYNTIYFNSDGVNSSDNLHHNSSLMCSEQNAGYSDIDGIYLNVIGWQFEECGLESIYLIATTQFPE